MKRGVAVLAIAVGILFMTMGAAGSCADPHSVRPDRVHPTTTSTPTGDQEMGPAPSGTSK